MEKNVLHTIKNGERVTCSYAEIYLDDEHCGFEKPKHLEPVHENVPLDQTSYEDKWISPSDLLIGLIELNPPFTSKITRGKTHEGILAIGNSILEKERARFLNQLTVLLHENDAAWNYILEHEKARIASKVKDIYEKIFLDKSKIMTQEISTFYEVTLQELESHLRIEIKNVLISAHANIISDLNKEIQQKLQKEKTILENILKKKYDSEIKKIKHYYKLLLNNELYRNNKLINIAINERNDALKAFCKQIEADTITSTMYVMSIERKKCRVKQFLLENIQTTDITEKLQKIKEREDVIDAFKEREVHISEMNKRWEEKITKIVNLFLKFISFSLKLLPEQTTFLLDIEKMVVLQLNEIIKVPEKAPSILLQEEDVTNVFEFSENRLDKSDCENEPFTIVRDLSDPILTPYGSRETLPPNVELPYFRLQRQFIYAKCDKFEKVKEFLASQRCKCRDKPPEQPSTSTSSTTTPVIETKSTTTKSESNELLLIDDIDRLQHCPVRTCQDWIKQHTFPYLDSYLDFTENNYERVKTILGELPKDDVTPQLLQPRDIAYRELPFAATKEKYRNEATQYSSQEDLSIPKISCPCVDDIFAHPTEPFKIAVSMTSEVNINKILMKRKISLQNLIEENPNLLKMFTDECFDFIM